MKLMMFLTQLRTRWPVKILCLALAIVLYMLFRINTLTERFITVPLEILVGDSFIVSADHPGSVRVSLRGNEEDILGILDEDIIALGDLTPYKEEGSYRVPIKINKKGTALHPEAMEIRVNPREVALSQERRTTQSLVVKPAMSGFPALGYELTQYFVSPTSVTAVGPRSQLLDVREVFTEAIDLAGRRQDFTVSTRLINPSDHVRFPGGGVVEFRGVVDEAVVIRTIADREIVLLDLDPAWQLAMPLPTLSLTVRGSQLLVESTRPQDMTFYIDASRIKGPGNYTLPVEMDISSGLAVLQFLPREISIQIIRKEESESPPPLSRGEGQPPGGPEEVFSPSAGLPGPQEEKEQRV